MNHVFSSPELKAHGLANSIPFTPASVRCPSTFSNIFSSETTGPIELNFHMETLLDRGIGVYLNGPGHIAKMATTPTYGENPLKIFSRNMNALGLGM